MAWRASGSTNAELIENLARFKLITQARVKEAMLGVILPFSNNPIFLPTRHTIPSLKTKNLLE